MVRLGFACVYESTIYLVKGFVLGLYTMVNPLIMYKVYKRKSYEY